jgi:hypothetical protein
MHTCLDQYKANQAANANGGLKWIQKDGGYYSECNKHLKGVIRPPDRLEDYIVLRATEDRPEARR